MSIQPELLSPAGSYDSLVAAINAGCDAVYLGGKKFGARAYASNFDTEELINAIDYCHINKVKIYLTINTVMKENELGELVEYLKPLYLAGLDGVIVQDIGAAAMIKKTYKDLPIHGSTQMTIHHSKGVEFLRELGFERVVLSRELHLSEIDEIIQGTDMEIECFVHGALCYAYSGQCLMSSILGGRSGNRGRCAGTCRLPYGLINEEQLLNNKDKRFLLSPKDIQTLSLLPELIKAGIHSFKIEGRMKSPEYVAGVTSIYRKYINLALNHPEKYKIDHKDEQVLLQLYNRGGFSEGYYKTYNGQEMMAMSNPKNWGVKVGKVKSIDKRRKQLNIQFYHDIHPGDCLEIWCRQSDPFSFITKQDYNKHQTATIKINDKNISVGDDVYRLKNLSLINTIKNTIINKNKHQNVTCEYSAKIREPFKVKLKYSNIEISAEGACVERAKNQAITPERIEKQLRKTGNSPFQLDKIEGRMEEDIFIPVSEINRVRRLAIDKLTLTILNRFKREDVHVNSYKPSMTHNQKAEKGNFQILIRHLSQFNVVKSYKWVKNILIEDGFFNSEEQEYMLQECKKKDIKLHLALPRIFRNKNNNSLRDARDDFDGYVIRTYGELQMFKNKDTHIIIDYNMNCFNNMSVQALMDQGADSIILSPELNKKELSHINHHNTGLLLYGYLPLMVSTQCVVGNYYNKSKCHQGGNYALKDRYGKIFKVDQRCKECYSMIYNTSPTILLDHYKSLLNMGISCYRIEFTHETIEKVKAVIKFVDTIYHGEDISNNELLDRLSIMEFNRGHLNRGIK